MARSLYDDEMLPDELDQYAAENQADDFYAQHPEHLAGLDAIISGNAVAPPAPRDVPENPYGEDPATTIDPVDPALIQMDNPDSSVASNPYDDGSSALNNAPLPGSDSLALGESGTFGTGEGEIPMGELGEFDVARVQARGAGHSGEALDVDPSLYQGNPYTGEPVAAAPVMPDADSDMVTDSAPSMSDEEMDTLMRSSVDSPDDDLSQLGTDIGTYFGNEGPNTTSKPYVDPQLAEQRAMEARISRERRSADRMQGMRRGLRDFSTVMSGGHRSQLDPNEGTTDELEALMADYDALRQRGTDQTASSERQHMLGQRTQTEQRSAAMRDPSSQESRRAQGVLAQVMPELGEAAIAGLSAEDIDAMGVLQMGNVRRNADVAAGTARSAQEGQNRRAEMSADARRYQADQNADARRYQADHRRGSGGGGTAQRASDGGVDFSITGTHNRTHISPEEIATRRETLAQLYADANHVSMGEARAFWSPENKSDLEVAVSSFGQGNRIAGQSGAESVTDAAARGDANANSRTAAAMQRAGIPQTRVSLQRAERSVANLSPAQFREVATIMHGGIPAITTGLSRDPAVQAAAQDMFGVINRVLRIDSGTAVSAQELQRQLGRAGIDWQSIVNNPTGMRRYLQGLQQELDAQVDNINLGAIQPPQAGAPQAGQPPANGTPRPSAPLPPGMEYAQRRDGSWGMRPVSGGR